MKKIFLFLFLVIISSLFIYYKYPKNDGLKFNYSFYGKEDGRTIYKKNKIEHRYEGGYSQYIEIYSKKPNQTIESAILDLVKAKGKNPNNCKVIEEPEFEELLTFYDENKGEKVTLPYSVYQIELVDSNIKYTQEEQKIIDELPEEGDAYFDTKEYKKRQIYNQRLIDLCSEYADPLGLSSSVTTPGRFIFNNKNKFIYLPGSNDPAFYDLHSIEF